MLISKLRINGLLGLCTYSKLRFVFHIRYLVIVLMIIATPALVMFYYINYEMLFDQWCWSDHFHVFFDPAYANKKKLIPASVEEAPIGFAASIPETFLIEEKDYCSKRPRLKIFSYVHSAILNVEERQTTRETWANASEAHGALFFVGRSKTKAEQKIVDTESKLYGDIVQGNYTDLYELLVYKALNALFWISKNCASVKWVVHADDDIILDVFYLLKIVDIFEEEERNNEIFCHTFVKALPRRSEKWKVELREYPCKFYPPYCSGPCWFASSNVIKKLLEAVPRTKYLWVDDTYLTGLAAEVSNVRRTTVPMIDFYLNYNDFGYSIAWLHVKGNRTKEWQNVLKFHNKI